MGYLHTHIRVARILTPLNAGNNVKQELSFIAGGNATCAAIGGQFDSFL
jgi:hypothetical protein